MHLKNHYQYSFHIILRNRDTHHGTLSTTEEQYYHKVKCLKQHIDYLTVSVEDSGMGPLLRVSQGYNHSFCRG